MSQVLEKKYSVCTVCTVCTVCMVCTVCSLHGLRFGVTAWGVGVSSEFHAHGKVWIFLGITHYIKTDE